MSFSESYGPGSFVKPWQTTFFPQAAGFQTEKQSCQILCLLELIHNGMAYNGCKLWLTSDDTCSIESLI